MPILEILSVDVFSAFANLYGCCFDETFSGVTSLIQCPQRAGYEARGRFGILNIMRDVDLFAVQGRIDPSLYESRENFEARLEAQARAIDALRERDEEGAYRFPALAVWPENYALFASLIGVPGASQAKSSTRAMARLALRRLPALVRTFWRHRPRSLEETLFTATAPETFALIDGAFAPIARKYQLHIVAGSAYLPRFTAPPFKAEGAKVYNTSLLYSDSGERLAISRKQNIVPTQEDILHLSPGDDEDLPVVSLPFGRFATLICYDGFNEAHTKDEPEFKRCGVLVDRLGAEIVAQPSANAWAWDEPWVFNEPGETMLRREQWFEEGLFRQLSECENIRYVVNPQLVGSIFEYRFEAKSLILARDPDAGSDGDQAGEVRIAREAETIDQEEILSLRVRV